MFVLDKVKYKDISTDNIVEFIQFWRQFYTGDDVSIYNSNENINYISELNINNNLTTENIKRLLRWKSPRYLTEIVKSKEEGKENELVKNIVNELDSFNQFRNNLITEKQFKNITDSIIKSDSVYKIYLFHIAKPNYYPIADQHVFRTFNVHTNHPQTIFWDNYITYKEYFDIMVELYIEKLKIEDCITTRKQVDEALMSFGQFLGNYNQANK